MNPLVLGAQLNAAIYLVCVFLGGGWTNHPAAWRLAIVAMGVTYLSYVVQITWPANLTLAKGVVALSVLVGALAGLALLV